MEQLDTADTPNIPIEELDIDEGRAEIDRLDAEILAALRRRTAISQAIGKTRMAAGGTRLVHSREMQILGRYGQLGPEGNNIGMSILALGRGALGR